MSQVSPSVPAVAEPAMTSPTTALPSAPPPALSALAFEAYATGYALSGARVTEQARTSCAAAVAIACEHAHDPAILEATLNLAALDGVWALVYDRREKLVRKHARRISAAWNALAGQLDPADLVAAFRAGTAHPLESVSPKRKLWRDAAAAGALAWLRKVYHLDGYQALVDAIADAVRAGMAEGEAGAIALAASKQGIAGLNMDRAFRAAYKRLADDHAIPHRAADAAMRLVDAIAGDAGRKMASLIPPDDDGDGDAEDGDVTAQVGRTMSGRAVDAIKTGVGSIVWAALGAGALAWYAIAGVQLVGWITAGDSRVCVICDANEANGPYPPDQFPSLPAHGRCRCSADTSATVPASFFAPFL